MSKESEHPKKVIFDMDGVILSEDCYWNTAALVVWELLYSDRYLGRPPEAGLPTFKTDLSPQEISAVRRVVFQDEQVISFFKKRAVNSNWDLAFYTFVFQLTLLFQEISGRDLAGGVQVEDHGIMLKHLSHLSSLLSSRDDWSPSFAAVIENWAGEARWKDLMGKLSLQVPGSFKGLVENSYKASSPLWEEVRDIFQEWYFGEEQYRELFSREPGSPGKKGLMHEEEPLLPVSKVKDTLRQLKEKGMVLGIATGRPYNELNLPLQKMNIWESFDKKSVVTFNDVQNAEQASSHNSDNISLGKPHPFSFLKAYWGDRFSDDDLLSSTFPRIEPGKCWAVGDSMADLLAAKKSGASFIGVLTGLRGAVDKSAFEKEGATAVLPDVTFLPRFFEDNK
ncbi:MAG: HAD hydrolase-like protein [Bacillota bacterium]|nr:HAD hydrolase-like protein [Bacillota bacterium]